MERDNTPTYNVNRKVANFGDYCNNIDKEKEDLKKIKRYINPNTPDTQKFPRNSKYKFNRITRKMDDLTPDIIDDTLKSMDEIDESMINESHIDYDIMDKITKLEAYNRLKEEFRNSLDRFEEELDNASGEIEYDSGDNDHRLAYVAAIQEIINEIV